MSIGSANQILKKDVGVQSTHFNNTPTINIDRGVVTDISISDKLQELAEVIAKSTNNQVEHNKTVLDLTIKNVISEFKTLVNEKQSDTNQPTEPDKINTETVNDVVIDNLKQQFAEFTLDKNIIAFKKHLQTHLYTLIDQTLAKITKKQIEVLTDSRNALSKTSNTLKEKLRKDDFTGNIFHRIWYEIKQRKEQRQRFRQKVKKDIKNLYDNTLHLLNPLYAIKRIKKLGSTIKDEAAELWSDRFKFLFGSKTKEEKQKEKQDNNEFKRLDKTIQSLLKGINKNAISIHKKLNKYIHKNIKQAYIGRVEAAIGKKPPEKTEDASKPTSRNSFMSIIAALAGVAIFATIAYDVSKLFRTQIKNNQIELPTIPNIEGFDKTPPVDNIAINEKLSNADSDADLSDTFNAISRELEAELNKQETDTLTVIDENLNSIVSVIDVPDEAFQQIEQNNTTDKGVVSLATTQPQADNIEKTQSKDDLDDVKSATINLLKATPTENTENTTLDDVQHQADNIEKTKTLDDSQSQEQELDNTIVNDLDENKTAVNKALDIQKVSDAIKAELKILEGSQALNEYADELNINKFFTHRSTAKNIVYKLEEINKALNKNVISQADVDKIENKQYITTRQFDKLQKTVKNSIACLQKAQEEQSKQIDRLKTAENALNTAIDEKQQAAFSSNIAIVNKSTFNELINKILEISVTISEPINVAVQTPDVEKNKVSKIKTILHQANVLGVINYTGAEKWQ